jgi:hypothetical protein
MRRLRHPLRLTSRIVTLTWLWRNRHDLNRWARFAARLPSDIRARGVNPVAAEARARIALTADPRTRFARDLDIASMDDGIVEVRTPVEKPAAQVAREVLTAAPGVHEVRLVDPPVTTDTRRSWSRSTPSTAPPTAAASGDDALSDDEAHTLGPAESRS